MERKESGYNPEITQGVQRVSRVVSDLVLEGKDSAPSGIAETAEAVTIFDGINDGSWLSEELKRLAKSEELSALPPTTS